VAAGTPRPDDHDTPDGATEELVAYLDGELDPAAAEAMATRLSLDPHLRAEADALQRAWDILDVLPRPQPSAAFLTRTVSQVIPTAAASATAVVPTLPPMSAGRSGGLFWGVSVILILVAGLGGYVGRALLVPRGQEYEQITRDAALLHNLRLYRTVEDLDYARQLDDPTLFGEEE
jgi:anti-sigma factor RsiW